MLASKDRWLGSIDLHSNCEGKAPTVTIIQVGTYTFGGDTDVSWSSSEYHFISTAGFRLSLCSIVKFLFSNVAAAWSIRIKS